MQKTSEIFLKMPRVVALALVFLSSASMSVFAPTSMAAEKKVIKIAFRAAENGFDPQQIEDRYSVGICENIFESFLTYDWLARPVKLAPQTVEKVPEGEEGGTRYTFRIKPGILFSDDPVFKGKKRELVAKTWNTRSSGSVIPPIAARTHGCSKTKLSALTSLSRR
jgi:ABC-type transport system substrate-binding protein